MAVLFNKQNPFAVGQMQSEKKPLLEGTENLPRLDDLANQLLAIYGQDSGVAQSLQNMLAGQRGNISNQFGYLQQDVAGKVNRAAQASRLSPGVRAGVLSRANTDIARGRAEAEADLGRQEMSGMMQLAQGNERTKNSVLGLAQMLTQYQLEQMAADRQLDRAKNYSSYGRNVLNYGGYAGGQPMTLGQVMGLGNLTPDPRPAFDQNAYNKAANEYNMSLKQPTFQTQTATMPVMAQPQQPQKTLAMQTNVLPFYTPAYKNTNLMAA